VYKLALIISLFVGPLWLSAQTAEDYFHGGAQYYIWNDRAKATNEIYTGLQKFPTDPLLNGLAALLKKEEQKQQQQQQNQQDQDKKDQDKKDQQNKDQENKQDQQNKSDQSKDSSQQQKEQQQKEQAQKDKEKEKQKQSAEQKKKELEKQEAQRSSGKPGDKDKQEGQQSYAVGQMTPQQAQQLLDAEKGHELMLPVKPEGKPRDPSKPLRDW
jgi:outer membrane biosynthesis protein TonB